VMGQEEIHQYRKVSLPPLPRLKVIYSYITKIIS
jgi:hypothetical protein